MIKFRGLDFPRDIKIFITTPISAHNWRKKVNKIGFSEIIHNIKRSKDSEIADDRFIEILTNNHKVMRAYLRRITKDPNPCMITSLVLLDICVKNNIVATLVVGADKEDNSVIGHSWIEVNGSAINEADKSLKKYTRMMEI